LRKFDIDPKLDELTKMVKSLATDMSKLKMESRPSTTRNVSFNFPIDNNLEDLMLLKFCKEKEDILMIRRCSLLCRMLYLKMKKKLKGWKEVMI